MNIRTLFSRRTLSKGLLGSVLVLSFSTLTMAGSIVSVKGDNVNVRTGPSTKKPVYMELSKGYPLKIVKRQGDWVKIVDLEGDSGWVHSNLVENGKTVIVNAKNKINMRSGPSTKSQVVAEVYRGVVLTKVTTKGNWVKVKSNDGLVGWIYRPLLWP